MVCGTVSGEPPWWCAAPYPRIRETSLFQYLWRKAFEYLTEAKEIVVIGYSLPSTDLLARAMFRNLNPRSLTKITIVDPSPAALATWRSTFERIKPTKAEWRYSDSIETFVSQLEARLN